MKGKSSINISVYYRRQRQKHRQLQIRQGDVMNMTVPDLVSNSMANLLPTGRKLANKTQPEATAERAWSKVKVFMARLIVEINTVRCKSFVGGSQAVDFICHNACHRSVTIQIEFCLVTAGRDAPGVLD